MCARCVTDIATTACPLELGVMFTSLVLLTSLFTAIIHTDIGIVEPVQLHPQP